MRRPNPYHAIWLSRVLNNGANIGHKQKTMRMFYSLRQLGGGTVGRQTVRQRSLVEFATLRQWRRSLCFRLHLVFIVV